MNMQKTILLFILFFCFYSCSDPAVKTEKEAELDPIQVTENIFNPFFIHTLFESPNNFGPIWNTDWTDSLDVKVINIYEKGNYTKSFLNSKMAYVFSKKGLPTSFLQYDYKFGTYPISLSSFKYTDASQLSQIEIYRQQEMENLPPVLVNSDSSKVTFVYFKSQDNDTTFVYPNLYAPKYILEKTGSIVSSVELFQDKKTDTISFDDFLFALDSSLVNSPALEKILTYTVNSLPESSYLLNENGEKSQKIKAWKYSKDNLLTQFEAYLHGSLTDKFEFTYNEANLPEKITHNRRNFLIYYGK